jgi:hypothetical protein
MNTNYSLEVVLDSGGVPFSPESSAHAYTYNGDGTLATDTATGTDGVVRIKTYTYTAGNVTAETKWTRTP